MYICIGLVLITKAEFDSLKNNFQAQIDNYNTSIDSKIDGAIAAYLAGVSVENNVTVPLDSNKTYNVALSDTWPESAKTKASNSWSFSMKAYCEYCDNKYQNATNDKSTVTTQYCTVGLRLDSSDTGPSTSWAEYAYWGYDLKWKLSDSRLHSQGYFGGKAWLVKRVYCSVASHTTPLMISSTLVDHKDIDICPSYLFIANTNTVYDNAGMQNCTWGYFKFDGDTYGIKYDSINYQATHDLDEWVYNYNGGMLHEVQEEGIYKLSFSGMSGSYPLDFAWSTTKINFRNSKPNRETYDSAKSSVNFGKLNVGDKIWFWCDKAIDYANLNLTYTKEN